MTSDAVLYRRGRPPEGPPPGFLGPPPSIKNDIGSHDYYRTTRPPEGIHNRLSLAVHCISPVQCTARESLLWMLKYAKGPPRASLQALTARPLTMGDASG